MVAACFDLFGHTGKLYAVNRGGKEAHGFPGYTSCTEIPDPADAAFIYVPAAAVVEALHDCAGAGIRNAVILSSGFAEAGEDGAAMQEEVARTARELGIDDGVGAIGGDDAPLPAGFPDQAMPAQIVERALGGCYDLDVEPLEEPSRPEGRFGEAFRDPVVMTVCIGR